jgi:osmotically inducible lipoprotein OsmB
MVRTRSNADAEDITQLQESVMSSITRASAIAVLSVAALSLAACSGMTTREKDTAIGAAVGGVAGSVLTGGGTVGTVGGAVVGGVIGNEVGKKK